MKLTPLLAVTVGALAVAVPAPAIAQSEDELRQQLGAQKALNEQLRKRVEELERRLSGAPPAPALQALEQRPALVEAETETETTETTTAIEEALVAKGLVLLPPGSFRLAPGFGWTHSGSSAIHTRSDTYTGSLSVQAGLPLGMMLSAYAPYVHRNTSIGSNSGIGDVSLGLSKKLNNESDRLPAFIASLNYFNDNGADSFKPVPIGSGFRAANVSLSALKRMEPVALYGGLAYTHAFARDVNADNLLGESTFHGRIDPGDAWSYRFGVSLAATPEITLDASLSGAFIRGTDVRSDAAGSFTLPKSTIVMVNLGAGFILARNLSLLISASAGATDNSPDFIFSASLPYRF
jgi:hypothetical protein